MSAPSPTRISSTSSTQIDSSSRTYSPQASRRQTSRIQDSISAQESQPCCGNFTSLFPAVWQRLVSIFRYFFPGSPQPQLEIPNETNSVARDSYLQPLYLNEPNLVKIAQEERLFWFTNHSEGTGSFLSNSYHSPIVLSGLRFANAEIAFQACKFRRDEDASEICSRFQQCLTSKNAIELADTLTATWTEQQRQDWNARQLDSMRLIIHAKFSQNPDLKELLLATRDAYLEYRVDYNLHPQECELWGHAQRGGWGENWLGKILVETRISMGGRPSIDRSELPIPTMSI